MKKWKPVAHRIVVKPDPILEKTASGIIVAQDKRMAMNAQVTGVIKEIGEDAWVAYKTKREFAGLKVGDRVAYAKYAGKWIDDETLALEDSDVVVVEVDDDVDATAPSNSVSK